MKEKMKNTKLILISLVLMFLTVGFASAQEKLRNGVAVRGEIGGEAHAKYVIRARRGQTITVVVTRRVARDGNFNLSVTRGAGGQDVPGKETNGRGQLVWTGKARATGNYYFDMTAHPTTRYTIRVTVS
jgi:hypothetical protein